MWYYYRDQAPVQYCPVHMGAQIASSCSLGVLRVWESSSARCVFTQTLPNTAVSQSTQEDGDPLSLQYCLYLPLCNHLATVTAEHNILLYQLPCLTVQQQVSTDYSQTHLTSSPRHLDSQQCLCD